MISLPNKIKTQLTNNLAAVVKPFTMTRILLVDVELEQQEAMRLGVKLTTKRGSRTVPEKLQMEASLKEQIKEQRK